MKHNFRKLEIWNLAIEIVEQTYLLIEKLPAEEKFGLKSQMSRSAVSIPSNIAEGSGRTSNKEFSHFLSISIASSYELETQLVIVTKLFQLNTDDIVSKCQNLQRMIIGFKLKLTSD